MKRHILQVLVILLLCIPMFFSCGKKPDLPVLRFGKDTLTVEQVRGLDPLGDGDSVCFRNVGIRLLLAGMLPDSTDSSEAERCRELLEIISNKEWSSDAAALLLRAADSILTYSSPDAQTCGAVRSKTRELMRSVRDTLVKPPVVAPLDSLICDSIDFSSSEGKLMLISGVLGVGNEIAKLVLDLVDKEDSTVVLGGDALKKMVNGLVRKKGEEPGPEADTVKGASIPELKRQQVDNPGLVLRFRNRKSIRDSIEIHIPNLKQLYIKNLKSNKGLRGKVVATIRVSAEGKVIKVSIKETEITNRAFLDPFQAYLKTIQFLPVPKKAGAMSFDFPFEFSEEL
jgi:hypothetical protein